MRRLPRRERIPDPIGDVAADRGDRQQDMHELEKRVPGDGHRDTLSATGWGRGRVDRGRSRILPGATGIAGEPAAGGADDGDVQLHRAAAEVEHDVRDGAGVPGWERFGGDDSGLIGVLAAAERLSPSDWVRLQPLREPIVVRTAVVLAAGV